MKAKTNKNRTLTTLVLLMMVFSIGQCQGFLAELNFSNVVFNSPANYSHVDDLEADIETEKWMTTPFSAFIETNIEVEDWMTESFSSYLESELEIKEWMTQPFQNSIESELVIEDWMTVSFSETTEENVSVEGWMTQAFASK